MEIDGRAVIHLPILVVETIMDKNGHVYYQRSGKLRSKTARQCLSALNVV